VQKLRIIIFFWLLSINLPITADCFIAKENNHIIHQEGVCSEKYKLLLNIDNYLYALDNNHQLENRFLKLFCAAHIFYINTDKQVENSKINYLIDPAFYKRSDTIQKTKSSASKNIYSSDDLNRFEFKKQNYENNVFRIEKFFNGWKIYAKTLQTFSSAN